MTTFMNDPAHNTTVRAITLWLAKLLGSEGSSSPTIFTNPPMGIRLMEYKVSPYLNPNNLGGKPKPNSVTLMSNFFAHTKWPSSWTKTKKPNIGITNNQPGKSIMFS